MSEMIAGRKSGSSNAKSPTVDPNDLLSISKTKLLLAICNGEIEPLQGQDIYLDGTQLYDDSGTPNFSGVKWDYRTGVQDQSYIQGIPGTENEISINVSVTASNSWTRSISDTQLSAIRITFQVPQIYEQESDGDVHGSYAAYVIELSTDGGAYVPMNTGAFDGKATSLYQRSIRIDLPAAQTGWTVRVRRTTPDSTSDRIVNAFGIYSYAEIVDAKFRYPLTALLYVEFDAENFDNVPAISVKARRIIRVPDNYDPVTRAYVGTWTGNFKYAFTDNPAWVFYDLVTNDIYGLGNEINVGQVDKWSLYEIAQYCDQLVPDGNGGTGMEPRFTCNAFIQDQNDAYTVLNDFAAIFRGMSYWGGDQVNVVADFPPDAYGIGFNNTNIVGGEFTYAGGSVRNRYTQVVVGYSDPGNHYSDVTKVSSVQSLVKRYGIRKANVTAIGCTRESEANRKGLYYIYTNQLDSTVSFSTGLEGFLPAPGVVFPVADYNKAGAAIGGRIVSVSGRAITLDREPSASVGQRMFVNLPSGISQERTIQAVSGKVVTVTTAYSETPEAMAVWMIESDELSLQYFRCTTVTDNNDGTFTVNGVIYNESKFDAVDTGARLETKNYSVTPSSTMQTPENVTISSYTFIEQTMAVTNMRVTWDAVDGAVKYEGQWKKDNNDWVNASTNSSTGFEVPAIYAGVYQARVRSINSGDVSSPWGYAAATTLTGKDGAPPMPENFRATTDQVFAIQLDWTIPQSAGDASYTEIQYTESSGGQSPTLLTDVAAPTHQYIQAGLRSGVTFFYRARLVDKTGNVSEWTDFVMGQSSFDADAIIDVIDDAIRESDAFNELKSPIDNNIEAILQNALNENATTSYQLKQYGENKAEILRVATTTADEFGAFSQTIDQVQASTEENSAAVQQVSTAVAQVDGKLSAGYGVKVQLNTNGQPYIAGMQIGIESNGQTVQSYALFNADTFAVYNGTGTNNSLPFVIQGGQVYIRDAFIADGAITNAKIGAFIQSTNYVASTTGWRLDKAGNFENNGYTAGQGRMTMTNTQISVYDGNGVLRVRMGQL